MNQVSDSSESEFEPDRMPSDFLVYYPSNDESSALVDALENSWEYDLRSRRYKKNKLLFMSANISVVIINIFFINYWLDAVTFVNVQDAPGFVQAQTVFILLGLIGVHILWILNFFFIFNLLTFKCAQGRAVYSMMFWAIFITRFVLSGVLMVVHRGLLNKDLGAKFNIPAFLTILVLLTIGDVAVSFSLK